MSIIRAIAVGAAVGLILACLVFSGAVAVGRASAASITFTTETVSCAGSVNVRHVHHRPHHRRRSTCAPVVLPWLTYPWPSASVTR